jgi:hypothetical protein
LRGDASVFRQFLPIDDLQDENCLDITNFDTNQPTEPQNDNQKKPGSPMKNKSAMTAVNEHQNHGERIDNLTLQAKLISGAPSHAYIKVVFMPITFINSSIIFSALSSLLFNTSKPFSLPFGI